MRGEKNNPYRLPWTVNDDWAWSMPEYLLILNRPKNEIVSVIIDPTGYMADINRLNNEYVKSLEVKKTIEK